MIDRFPIGSATASPPLEKGRSASAASRVGIKSRFDRTKIKTGLARRLRRDSTDVESKLWHKLRNNQIDSAGFRRQHPAGPYVLDFYCPALRLAIELDGGQHNEGTHSARDRKRDDWLAERGVTVLRFWNSDIIKNLSGVLEAIAAKIAEVRSEKLTPTRRWRADLPLSGGGIKLRGE
jgi:very-short-patch-repair endonuclease